MRQAIYFLYVIRCRDGSLYTGITTDMARRLAEHSRQLPGGARYTGAHPPLSVAALWQVGDRAAASRLEYRVKRLAKEKKERLIRNPFWLPCAVPLPEAEKAVPFLSVTKALSTGKKKIVFSAEETKQVDDFRSTCELENGQEDEPANKISIQGYPGLFTGNKNKKA